MKHSKAPKYKETNKPLDNEEDMYYYPDTREVREVLDSFEFYKGDLNEVQNLSE